MASGSLTVYIGAHWETIGSSLGVNNWELPMRRMGDPWAPTGRQLGAAWVPVGTPLAADFVRSLGDYWEPTGNWEPAGWPLRAY